MPALRVSSLSTEYVKTQISYKVDGVVADPTIFTVHWAFTTPGSEPSNPDWVLGSWESFTAGSKYYARALIGPGGIVSLPNGQYDAWVRVTGVPEIPVKFVGRLVIT